MSSSFYEIFELPNGDVVLRRSEEGDAPLVSIRFSAESLAYLGDSKFEVAKAMIEAGMDAASDVANHHHEDFAEDGSDSAKFLLH
jgi:hypothetical protein